ncbi:MAG: hypothetical protein ACMVP2_25100 [Imperialibacter sp.]|uniref:hypothetical protein n=1 Tax=Imperialibacter sp. TaxID=2038411 RepID=UPI003A83EBC1
MNTKIIMTLAAVILGTAGIALTFMPDALLNYAGMEESETSLLLMQILGAMYFAFAMLNWMSKGSLIGGIYNRPVAVANMTHFLIGGLALVKVLMSNSNASYLIWTVGVIYAAFAVCFGIILFRHPVREAN